MEILHVTDTHLGLRRYVRGGPPGWSRAADHLDGFRRALGPALAGEVDLVVHSGDLFDRSRPPAEAVLAAGALLTEVGRQVPVVLLPGNHDRHGLLRHFPRPPSGVHVVDAPERLRVAGVSLALVPFRRDAEHWADDAGRAWGGGADLLVAHQAFHGAWAPGITFHEGAQRDTVGVRHLPPGVRHVLCGHLHPRQVVRVGEAEVVQPGSTERTSFVERDQVKGYCRWTLDRRVTWRFVDLPTRPMAVVEGEADVAGVGPGTLVRCRRPDLEREVEARGGWLVGPHPLLERPPPAPSPQLGLF